MSFFNRQTTFQQDKPVIASCNLVQRTRSATLRRDTYSRSPDNKITSPEGIFVVRYFDTVAGEDLFRALPRVELVADLIDGVDTSFAVKGGYSQVLVAGDVLNIVEPIAANSPFVVNAGAGNTASFLVNGVTYSFTTTETAAVDVAAEIAAYFNGIPQVAGTYYLAAEQGTANLHVFITDGVTLDVNAADATVGTAFAAPAVLGPAVVNTTPVGTVNQVDPVTGDVVLTAAAGAGLDLPPGAHLGVTSLKEIYGLYDHSLDFTEFKTEYPVGLVDHAKVYRGALAYFDGTIKAALPDLDIQFKF